MEKENAENAANRLKLTANRLCARGIEGVPQMRRDCEDATRIIRNWAKLLEMPTTTLAEWNERSLELERMLKEEAGR